MIIFDIQDVTTEAEAQAVADRLSCEAIKASCALRNKRRKIKVVTSKIECLMKWCVRNKWDAPLTGLKSDFETLEEASSELNVNVWGI